MRLPVFLGASVAAASLVLGSLPASAAPGDTVFVLTSDNSIVSFAPGSPGTTTAPVAITGLNAGETLLGIDFRPANNQLYGLGSSSQLYTVNTTTGAATKVGGPFSPSLAGNQAGFDFNPTVDRIRVVTDSGQNLRLHPDTGAVVATDGSLAYKAGDTNATVAKAISGAAYTNPDNDPATGTTLFDIDGANSVLVRQDPPNDGTLNTVGPLGVTTSQQVAFDIGPNAGALLANRPNAGTGSRLYRVDLATGAATEVGMIGSGVNVLGLAIRLEAAPAPPASATPTVVAPAPPNTGTGLQHTSSTSVSGWTMVLAVATVATVAGATATGLAVARAKR